jgi:hypothetical protein
MSMDECLWGRCYYCGRHLISAVPLAKKKREALYKNLLTCGPCVHVHGRPPWRGTRKGPHAFRRLLAKRAMT